MRRVSKVVWVLVKNFAVKCRGVQSRLCGEAAADVEVAVGLKSARILADLRAAAVAARGGGIVANGVRHVSQGASGWWFADRCLRFEFSVL
jgi:hypothetical protein